MADYDMDGGDGGKVDDQDVSLYRYIDMVPAVAEEFTPEELDLLEDFVSDEEDFDPEAQAPQMDYGCVIIVDNLPKVGEAKIPKLKQYVMKAYSKLGKVVEDGLHMPTDVDESGATMSLGFAFIEFQTPEQASAAVTSTNNWQFDKKHKLSVYHYKVLHTSKEVPEVFEAPKPKSYDTGEDLYSWMFDKACRDQFALRYDRETEVLWGETKQQPALEYAGEREKVMGKVWVEDKVAWSPMGTYLTTFHKRGVALWGGHDFRKMRRFPHLGVHTVRFSADERFLATWNGIDMHHTDVNFPEAACIVWDVRTGRKLRELSQVQRSGMPDFYWTADGSFLVRLAHVYKRGASADAKTFVRVYETPRMGLLGKSAIKADGAQEMTVSPTDNIVAWWAPEAGAIPACVSLCELPSKRIIRTKNLFNVKSCRLHWQDSGDFLCVQVTRTSRSGKTEFTNLELFRLREKNIPIEMLHIKEKLIHFSWEPSRTRFGVIHGDGPSKFDVTFYDMGPSGSKLQSLFTLEQQGVNEMFWSPLGQYVVLAAMKSLNGERLDFFDVDSKTSLAVQEHYLCTDVNWDPSGRIVTTSVCQSLYGDSPMRFTMQNGYMLWTFQGIPIHEEGKEKLFQFLWRPRPPSLLSRDEKAAVKANLRKSIARYQAADRRKANRTKYKKYLQRHEERVAYQKWVEDARAELEADRAEMVDLQGYDSETEECEYVEHTYEVVLGKQVEEVSSFSA